MKEFRLEQIEAIPASGVDVNPSGNLGSSDVQAALLELQADIDAIGGASVGGYSMIWAEQNGSLSTGGGSLGNGEQFSWGNGGTQNQLPIGFDCTVTYLVIESYSSTTATVTLYKNGVSTDASVSLSSGTLGTAVVNVAVNQGDTLVFRTTSGSGGTAVVVGAVLRSGAVGDELVNDVSPQLGGNLDMNGFTIAGATEAELALLDLGTQTVVANEVLVGTGAGTAAWQQLAANQVTVTPSDNLTSTDIQSALTELQGDIDTINSAGYLTDITGEALIDLSDTPANYTTHANKFLRVNSTPNAVEFVAASAINLSDFNDDLSYISAANLAIANKTATNLDITIDVGTNATVPAATAIEAGLMIATDKSKLDGIESGAKDDQNASEVPVTPIGNLTSTDVQAALAELQGDIDTINAAGYLTDITGESFVDLNDTPANYAGASNYLVSVNSTPNALEFIAKSSINLSDFNDDLTYIGAANLSLGTHNANTLGVLIDAGTDITLPAATTSLSGLLTGSDKTKLDGIEANAKDDQVASQVPVTPTGNLVATDVQAALNELQGDIDGINALGYLQNVVEDTTPQLGGDLDAQSNAITNVDHLTFDTDAGYSVGVGELAWNADEETLDLGQNGAVLQVGQEIHYHVRNNSGSNIGEGVAVMATGTLGASGRITIDEFNNDGSISPEYFMGITTESIDNNADGKVTHFGKVRGIDTSGTPYGETWSDGDLVYADATTAGALTNVQPTAPSMRIAIAIVIHAHASAGTLFVRAALNEGVHDLHDVDLTGLADGNVLTYKSSNQTWINETLSAAGISEVGHGHTANEITVTPTGNLASTDTQAALQELQGDIDTINSAGYLTDITGENFTDLSDTPTNYTTHANKLLRVNGTPDGVEFVATGSLNLSDFNDDLNYITTANLSLGTSTPTTIPVNIDTGTDVVLPQATTTLAGLLSGSDKQKLDYLTVTQVVDLDNLEQDVADLSIINVSTQSSSFSITENDRGSLILLEGHTGNQTVTLPLLSTISSDSLHFTIAPVNAGSGIWTLSRTSTDSQYFRNVGAWQLDNNIAFNQKGGIFHVVGDKASGTWYVFGHQGFYDAPIALEGVNTQGVVLSWDNVNKVYENAEFEVTNSIQPYGKDANGDIRHHRAFQTSVITASLNASTSPAWDEWGHTYIVDIDANWTLNLPNSNLVPNMFFDVYITDRATTFDATINGNGNNVTLEPSGTTAGSVDCDTYPAKYRIIWNGTIWRAFTYFQGFQIAPTGSGIVGWNATQKGFVITNAIDDIATDSSLDIWDDGGTDTLGVVHPTPAATDTAITITDSDNGKVFYVIGGSGDYNITLPDTPQLDGFTVYILAGNMSGDTATVVSGTSFGIEEPAGTIKLTGTLTFENDTSSHEYWKFTYSSGNGLWFYYKLASRSTNSFADSDNIYKTETSGITRFLTKVPPSRQVNPAAGNFSLLTQPNALSIVEAPTNTSYYVLDTLSSLDEDIKKFVYLERPNDTNIVGFEATDDVYVAGTQGLVLTATPYTPNTRSTVYIAQSDKANSRWYLIPLQIGNAYPIDQATAPTDTQVLTWNDTNKLYQPADARGGSSAASDLPFFRAYKSGDQTINNTYTDLTNWTLDSDTDTSHFSFNTSTGELEILTTGNILILVNINAEATTTNRTGLDFAVQANRQSAGYAIENGFVATSYAARGSNSVPDGGRTLAVPITATAGDKFKITAKWVSMFCRVSQYSSFQVILLKGAKGDPGPAGGFGTYTGANSYNGSISGTTTVSSRLDDGDKIHLKGHIALTAAISANNALFTISDPPDNDVRFSVVVWDNSNGTSFTATALCTSTGVVSINFNMSVDDEVDFSSVSFAKDN